MTQENYIEVGIYAMRNADDSLLVDVPVYVRVAELRKSGLAAEEENLVHKISAVLMGQHNKKILQRLTGLKGVG